MRLDVGKLDAPIAGGIEFADRPRQTTSLVTFTRTAVMVLRPSPAAWDRAWCVPTGRFIEFILAIALDRRGALPRQNIRRQKMCAAVVLLVTSRILRAVGVGLLDPAISNSGRPPLIAPLDRAVAVFHRMQAPPALSARPPDKPLRDG